MRRLDWMRVVGALVLAPAAWAWAQDQRLEVQDQPYREWKPGHRLPPPADRRGFDYVQVNLDAGGANIPGDAANEPSIAVDPTDPRRMAIGWRQFDTISSSFRQAGWAYSRDSGRTWTFVGTLEPGVFRSDPVLRSNAEGVFFYNSLITDPEFLCDVFVSTDGGATWPVKHAAFGGDKAWMTIDMTGGVGHGHIYEAWSSAAGCCGSNIFTRSLDDGDSWMTPIAITGNPRWGTPAVDPDGLLFIPGVQGGSGFVVVRSSNARDPGAQPTFDQSVSVSLGGAHPGIGLPPNPAGIVGQVWLDIDRSDGARRGHLYLLCSVDPSGSDPLDVRLARSTDHGATWDASVKVNPDPAGANSWQWFGTLGVAPNGRLDVVWNDTSESGSATLCKTVYSFSNDGGDTWSAPQALTPQWNSALGWPQQQKIGDYYDIHSDNVGADLAFAATMNGEQDVYFVRLGDYDCNHNGVGDATDLAGGASRDCNGNGIPDECEYYVVACDVNCDGSVDGQDIGPFIDALNGAAPCSACGADTNGDGSINGHDIQGFIGCLNAP